MGFQDRAAPERHFYDSYPEPKPFWIATCLAQGCNIALNSGHHYTDRSLALDECHCHNVIVHPFRAFGDEFTGWETWSEGDEEHIRFNLHDNSASIRFRKTSPEEGVISSIAVFEPKQNGLATALLSVLLSGHLGVKWKITTPLSPEAEGFWDHARRIFPAQTFAPID